MKKLQAASSAKQKQLSQEKETVTKLRSDAEATQNLFFDKSASIEKLQADAESNRSKRSRRERS